MVITVEIENYAVKKVLVDQGSSVDILNWATYQKLQLPDTAMIPYDEPIYGFSGKQVSTRGYIDLHTVFREATQTKTIPIRFLIVDAPTSYNILLGASTWCQHPYSRLYPSLGHEVPSPIRRHPDHPLRPTPGTQVLYGKLKTTTPNPTNKPYRMTP